jgi:UDPglucose--hexose-1-phosphate uridylyltransferase
MSSPEIRIDQLTGMRTILAPARADRPEGLTAARAQPRGPEGCPFCEGSEMRTPPEVFAIRAAGGGSDTPGWSVRVVPTLSPAFEAQAEKPPRPAGAGPETAFGSSADPLRASSRGTEPDLFASRPAEGAHEVIISAPEHVTALAELSDERLATTVEAWRERMRAHGDAAYAQLIVNEGGGAGASLEHTHAQLYALPFVPPEVARERERVSAYRERTAGAGLLTDVLAEEVRRGERMVAIDDEVALICPWASRSPFELRILPRREAARFEQDGTGAEMLGRALRGLAERFGGSPELNLWVRTAPHGTEHFHWHIDIAPRLSVKAGFELGTGVDINTYPPERAAADLRESIV